MQPNFLQTEKTNKTIISVNAKIIKINNKFIDDMHKLLDRELYLLITSIIVPINK